MHVEGDLKVEGEVTAHKLHVNELTSDTRTERTTPLEFKGENDQPPYNKGLIWTGSGPTRQLMFREGEDRFFSSTKLENLLEEIINSFKETSSKEIILVCPLALSSLVTGPKIRVPIGSPLSSVNTTAFVSN